LNPNELLKAVEQIIRATEAKVEGLDPEHGSALSYYALGYQQIKQLIERQVEEDDG
jgi:hypothetical protein